MSGSSAQMPPTPAAPEPAPTLEDPAVKTAQKEEIKANLLRKGRASTIVAGNSALEDVNVNKKVLLGQ